MASSKKTKNITMRVHVLKRLQQKQKERLKKEPTSTNIDLGGFINDMLQESLDKEDFLALYYPHISFIGVNSDVLYLRDETVKDKHIEIVMKDRKIYCRYHKTYACEHIRYSFAIPEISKLYLDKSDPSLYSSYLTP